MTKEQAQALGAYLRTNRTKRHLSAERVAAEAGVDPAQIRRLEGGTVRTPQPQVLARVADLLRLPVNDLLVLAGYPTSRTLPTIEPYLRAKYPRLTLEQRARVAAIIGELDGPDVGRNGAGDGASL